jgi:tRNA dimethylallyltransferase
MSAAVLAIVGPTCSGKSALALTLARQGLRGRPVEIISMDSAQVYRGMDIGTAKPTAAERAAVPHHLIDIVDPRDSYSAAQFAADALRLAGEIRARGHEPLIAGGTMLYLKALRDGLDAMPPADAAVRAQLDKEARARGWPALHAELARVDPVTAARLAPNDAQRIQRALEVWRVSGRPLSSHHAARRAPALPLKLLSLEPQQRGWLHGRIADRFRQMVAAGLLDEVRALRARGDLHAGLPSMRCVGYRQAWAHLDGQCDFDAFVERGIAATRQLAKRQLTWLRAMPGRDVIACDAPDALARALQAVQREGLDTALSI